ncbi:DMT family transporter [Terribacillus saccharophilus]|uniref:DMT family transporter n=2 Tax=Terribacillus saccharophilus TaxID=361277 RepID=UPI002989D5BD|nr:multidrug efflux SMR transporter [Terribacillus saccharophilus]MCM3225860.1 multidrug efflux SMR transporter [Terribacillus saccharophilus]MEC0302654.1 multidrug efflux SMR transporter [Terribacillus saccharophilus]
MKAGIFLALAIVLETIASSMLKVSDGFSILLPSIIVVVGYLGAFLFLSFTLKSMSLSTAYATWSGAGTALTAMIGITVFGESASWMKFIGLALVIVGLVLLNTQHKEAKEKEASAQ